MERQAVSDDISAPIILTEVRERDGRDPKLKAQYLQDWHFEQRIFDIVNDVVGPRNKAKLENRSYADEASCEGKTLDEFRRNRALRDEYVG